MLCRAYNIHSGIYHNHNFVLPSFSSDDRGTLLLYRRFCRQAIVGTLKRHRVRSVRKLLCTIHVALLFLSVPVTTVETVAVSKFLMGAAPTAITVIAAPATMVAWRIRNREKSHTTLAVQQDSFSSPSIRS